MQPKDKLELIDKLTARLWGQDVTDISALAQSIVETIDEYHKKFHSHTPFPTRPVIHQMTEQEIEARRKELFDPKPQP